jgi:hypothetical protein
MVAVKVMCHALNKISFFASNLEATSVLARVRVRASTGKDNLIKL